MQGHRIGYVRVSSFDQNPERQLEHVQVDKVFTDKASGKDTQRPQLDALLAFVREGDTVVVHSMDRLARNLDDLRRLVQRLTQRGVRIEFVKECLTFTGEDSPMANLMLSVMGAFAEFERALIRERQREGIAENASLVDIDLPRPVAAGHDILVEVMAVSVNPVDYKVRGSSPPADGDWKVLGWDAAGIVREVGSEVTQFKAGDEVYYAGSITRSGTNAQFHLVDARIVGKKPTSLDWGSSQKTENKAR